MGEIFLGVLLLFWTHTVTNLTTKDPVQFELAVGPVNSADKSHFDKFHRGPRVFGHPEQQRRTLVWNRKRIIRKLVVNSLQYLEAVHSGHSHRSFVIQHFQAFPVVVHNLDTHFGNDRALSIIQ